MNKVIDNLTQKIRRKLAKRQGRIDWTEKDHIKTMTHFKKFMEPTDKDFDCLTMSRVNIDVASELLTADCEPIRMIFDYDPNCSGVIVRKAFF